MSHNVNDLRRRYVRVVKIGDEWNTYFRVGVQDFCVVEQTSHHRAMWFGKMLSIALKNLLEENEK